MGSITRSSRKAHPAPSELRELAEANRPATVLSLLEGDIPANLEVFRAEALYDLDRMQEAYANLEKVTPQLMGEELAEAERLRSVILMRAGWVDASILSALRAVELTQDFELKAAALAWSAVGLAHKTCFGMATANLREAIEMRPNAPRVLMAQARYYLESDRRIEARNIYERMRVHDSTWTRNNGTWGCSYIAYLLGEFDTANRLAEEALQNSSEMITPLFVKGQVALACENLDQLEEMVTVLKQRSPQAESLATWEAEIERMSLRKERHGIYRRKRLPAFPTLVQRKDFCGPSAVELVIRYWQGGASYSNEYIAEKVKLPQAGTPIYRMREFFHLAGFDTVRTRVPVPKLKELIDAGFPVIVQENFSNTAHVAVVIGYDEEARVVELQDPMTHIVTHTPEDEFNRLRRIFLDGALIAFPRGSGHEKRLSRMGIYDHLALVWCDQAILALDQNRIQEAIQQAEKTARKTPALALGWVMLCHAKLEDWRESTIQRPEGEKGLVRKLSRRVKEVPGEKRESFYQSLSEASRYHEGDAIIYEFRGAGAMLEHKISKALAAFKKASDLDPQNARYYVSLAECHFARREFEKAYQAAAQALEHDPRLPAANGWMARSLAAQNAEHAEHYARMAFDLNPDWWLAYQAMAEACLQQGKLQEAIRAAEMAISLSQGEPEARVLKGVILARMNDRVGAAQEIQAILEVHPDLIPAALYRALQTLAEIAYEDGLFAEAIDFNLQLLAVSKDDPWALQHLAAARCEDWLDRKEKVSEERLSKFMQLYEKAIKANRGAIQIVRDYMKYLEAFAGLEVCQAAAERLRQAYPENGNLLYWIGDLYLKGGDKEAATQMMIESLSRPDGVMNRDELYEAAKLILETRGMDQAERILLKKDIPEGGSPYVERQRALGLALAQNPGIEYERGRELLLFALSENPDDALVILRLGDISPGDENRELCYRRALELDPGWSYARANLARYLVSQGREMEAWEFTSGHAHESIEMLVVHGLVLLGIGHFEESTQAFEMALEHGQEGEDDLYAYLWLAQLRSGRYQDALKTARTGLRLFRGEPEWFVREAETLRNLGRIDEAEAILERGMRKGLSTSDLMKAEYEIAWMRKDYDTAMHLLEALMAAEVEPTELGRLGKMKGQYLRLLVARGDFEAARDFLLQEDLSAEGWGEAARATMLSDESELTLELAERALAFDPAQYNGLFARAEALDRLGREEAALKAIEKLMEVYPEEHHAYEKLALRFILMEDLERAFELADRSVELGVYCPFAWATRGLVQFLDRRPVEALGDLQNGWNRADPLRREKMNHFWWLMAELLGDYELADQRKYQALLEARTDLDRRIVAAIEAVLADQLATQDFPNA